MDILEIMVEPKPKIRDAAETLARHGWSIVPIAPRKKRPLIAWTEYQQRQASDAEIQTWFERWPDANLAVVTGQISDIVVLDIDPGHKGDVSIVNLEQRYGTLPETVEAKSGGGGRHVYFRHPGGAIHNRVGIAPGIDFRGDGGLIVVPPSVHPSGNRYEWLPKRGPDEIPLTPMPDWLAKLTTLAGTGHGHPLAYWRALAEHGVEEGVRNTTMASLAGHLLWHGVDPNVATELLLCWNRVRCRPPLTDDEVRRTVRSIARLHLRHRGDELQPVRES